MTVDVESRETWEEEVLADHRWGQQDKTSAEEHVRLQNLWHTIQPVSESTRKIIDQVVSLEICNWNLVASIVALCEAIGQNRPAEMAIGHYVSISSDRWRELWAYDLALRSWIAGDNMNGYVELLQSVDPYRRLQTHVCNMLGEKTYLKKLYVERLCLCLERWPGGWTPWDSPELKGHRAAAEAIEEEINKRDSNNGILNAMRMSGDGRLQPCNHKAFRRYDIIISSIGCGKWRGTMPARGTDGLERADLLASYINPINAWIENEQQAPIGSQIGNRIVQLLGERDGTKRFLASLLVSLMRSQELSARKRAEGRRQKPDQ